MILVFANVKNKTVELYSEKGLKTVPFSELNSLKRSLKDKKVIYITNAKITTIDKIVDALTNSPQKSVKNNFSRKKETTTIDNSPKYIRAKNGSIYLQNPLLDLKKGSDFMPVQDLMKKYGKNVMETSTMKNLLKNGFIEIVNQKTMERITQEADEKISRTELLVTDLNGAQEGSSSRRDGPGKDAVSIDINEDIRRPSGGDTNEGTLITGDDDL